MLNFDKIDTCIENTLCVLNVCVYIITHMTHIILFNLKQTNTNVPGNALFLKI